MGGSLRQDYSFSTQRESEPCFPIYDHSYEAISEQFFFFAVGACFTYAAGIHVLSYMQSAITTSQRVHVACIEILLELQNIRPTNGLRSDLLSSNLTNFSWWSMPPDPPTYYMWYVARLWPQHLLEIAYYAPACLVGGSNLIHSW